MRRLLLFGGAFNPPHKGHERLLGAAINALAPDVTVILPTALSPHKQSAVTPFSQRAAMARVFLKHDGAVISEIERQGRKRRNYTIQSLKRLCKIYKGHEVFLLIGSDMLESFTTWSRYRRILSKAVLVAAAREEQSVNFANALKRIERDGGKILWLDFQPVVVSSSELRKKIAGKEDVSQYIDLDVLGYIERNRIYRIE